MNNWSFSGVDNIHSRNLVLNALVRWYILNKLFKDKKNALVAPGAIYHSNDTFGVTRLYTLQENSKRLHFTFYYELTNNAPQVFLNTAVFLGSSDKVDINTIVESYDMAYNSDLGSSNNVVAFHRRDSKLDTVCAKSTSTISVELSDLLHESESIRIIVTAHNAIGNKSSFKYVKRLKVLVEDESDTGKIAEYRIDLNNGLPDDACSIQFITISHTHNNDEFGVFTKVEVMPLAFFDDVMLKWLLHNFSSDIVASVLADLNAHEISREKFREVKSENKCSSENISSTVHGSFLDRLIQSSIADRTALTNLFKK